MRLLIKYNVIAFLFVCTICQAAFSQQSKRENVWVFGTTLGLNFNNVNVDTFEVPYNGNIGITEAAASVCDTNGQLLFYTEGSNIRDRNYNLMPNGIALTGIINFDGLGSNEVTASCSQGALIVPMPDSANKYYVFSLTEKEEGVLAGRLYYSIVDMELNSGLGDVEPGWKGILLDSNLTESMTGVVGNKCDIWVMVRSKYQAQFKAFEITSAGINTTPIPSPAGGISLNNSYTTGRICFSPDRKKMAIAHFGSYSGNLELYDFDAATGNLSNRLVLDSGGNNYAGEYYYGVCFSPDNSKLYAAPQYYIGDSTVNSIFQFDLSSGNPTTIVNSKTNIGTSSFTALKLAPNGKIYFVENGSHGDFGSPIVLGAINLPNLAGSACQYAPQVFAWPGSLGYGDEAGFPNAVPVFHRDTTHSARYLHTPCFATSYIIFANDSGWDYHWDNDTSIQTYLQVDSTGNYVVHYYTAPCVYHSDTFYVYFSSPLPSIGSLSGCPGMRNGKAWVLPHPGDTTNYTYTWTDNLGETLQPSFTSSVIADTLYNQYAGTYLVSISGDNGCDTTLPVVIAQPDDSGFLHVSDTGMCPHDTIAIHVTGGTSYHWYVDSNAYISDTVSASPMVSPPTDWGYIVYGKNASGCLDTATAKVQVYPQAVVQLPDSVTLYYGESFLFSPETNCLSFNWFPPLGLNADNISNPVASPPVNTKYIVTGTTEHGCSVQESVNVYRSDDVLLTLPNAFSPGNGPNNLLKPIYRGNIQLDYLRIFNRWGQMVYESSDMNEGWDGTWHGIPQQEGVFVYIMQGHTAEGRVLSKQGNITIVR